MYNEPKPIHFNCKLITPKTTKLHTLSTFYFHISKFHNMFQGANKFTAMRNEIMSWVWLNASKTEH